MSGGDRWSAGRGRSGEDVSVRKGTWCGSRRRMQGRGGFCKAWASGMCSCSGEGTGQQTG